MSLPASFRSSGGQYSEKVTVVGRPRLDSEGANAAGAAGLDGTRKRKAPFEPAVHLQPPKVVVKGTDDRRCVPKQISCLTSKRCPGRECRLDDQNHNPAAHGSVICHYYVVVLSGTRLIDVCVGGHETWLFRTTFTPVTGSFPTCRVKKKKTEYLVNCVPPDTTQEEYYRYFEGVVSAFTAQCNCDAAILAYGATGSGKTFSTQGPDLGKRPETRQNQQSWQLPAIAGIIQRAIQQVLQVSTFPFW